MRRSDYWDDEPHLVAQTVHEQECETFTGLYDQHGAPLHRPKQPMGFDPNRWATKPKKRQRVR